MYILNQVMQLAEHNTQEKDIVHCYQYYKKYQQPNIYTYTPS